MFETRLCDTIANRMCNELIDLHVVDELPNLILLLSFGSLFLIIFGFTFLWFYRNHHSIRAAGVELSVCILAATSLRVIHMFLNVLTPSTRLLCTIRFFLPTWATVQMLTIISLKACFVFRFLINVLRGRLLV